MLDYLSCLQSLKKAAALRDEEQHEAALEEVETALESIYNAIDTLGDVAQDQSDRGLIAILIKYA